MGTRLDLETSVNIVEYACQREYSWRHIPDFDASRFVLAWEEQEGRCKLCREPLYVIARGVHVDHCHRTLRFRGLLCLHCNTGLGMFADNPERLRLAADYVESKRV